MTLMNGQRSLRSYHCRRHGDWMISHKGHQKWRKCLGVPSARILVRKEKGSCQWLRGQWWSRSGKKRSHAIVSWKLHVHQLQEVDKQIKVNVSTERALHHIVQDDIYLDFNPLFLSSRCSIVSWPTTSKLSEKNWSPLAYCSAPPWLQMVYTRSFHSWLIISSIIVTNARWLPHTPPISFLCSLSRGFAEHTTRLWWVPIYPVGALWSWDYDTRIKLLCLLPLQNFYEAESRLTVKSVIVSWDIHFQTQEGT